MFEPSSAGPLLVTLDLGPLTISLADLLRLVAVPVLGWAAWRDIRTRRVPNRVWWPLVGIAVVALALDATQALRLGDDAFFLRVAISLGFVVPLAYGFWWMGGFGGADAKAFMTLAVLYPVYPTIYLPTTTLPLEPATLGVFSLTILSNTVVVGLAYPLAVALGNLLEGDVGWPMLLGRRIRWSAAVEEYGRLLEDGDGFTRRGLDLDALRMYLQWRGVSLAEVREGAAELRDPDSLPEEPNPPGDGSIATDGGDPAGGDDAAVVEDGPSSPPAEEFEDPWGAAAFLADIDHGAYGTTADQLRDGLDLLAEREAVWLSPGIPFIVPTFVGLLVALTYGDVLFVLVQASGLA